MRKIIFYIITAFLFPNSLLFSQQAKDNYSSSSLLSSGDWIKIAVTEDGIYRLDYSDLVGLDLENPSEPALFGNNKGQLSYYVSTDFVDDLIEIPVYIEKGADNIFNEGDYLLFFGQATGKWKYDYNTGIYNYLKHDYSDTSFYFLTSGKGNGKRVTNVTSSNPDPTYTSTDSDVLFEREIEEQNILKSGRQWFERLSADQPLEIDPKFDNLVENEAIRFDIIVAARSSAPAIFRFNEGSTVHESIQTGLVDMSDFTGIQAKIVDSTGFFYPEARNLHLTSVFIPTAY